MPKSDLMTEYKAMLQRYGFTDAQIGLMFGYTSAASWYHSTRRQKVIQGIVEFESLIKLHLHSPPPKTM